MVAARWRRNRNVPSGGKRKEQLKNEEKDKGNRRLIPRARVEILSRKERKGYKERNRA